MPKLFPINIEVEEAAVGKVFRILNDMPGVAKIKLGAVEKSRGKLNGGGEPHEPRTRKAYRKFETTGEELITSVLFKQGAKTTQQLRDLFVAEERSPASVSSQLHEMKNSDEIKSTPDGWVLSKKARDRLRHRVANKKTRR